MSDVFVLCPKCYWSANVPSRDWRDALELHDFETHDPEGEL